MRRLVLFALASALLPSPGRAHDFWLVPSPFRPAVPGTLAVGLRVGDVFPTGEPYPRNPAHVRRFAIVGPGAERRIPGRPGEEPAGRIDLDQPGTYVVGYWSRPTVAELPAGRFEDYTRDERLADTIQRLRPGAPAAGPVREAFSRCAKAIVVTADGTHTGHDRPLGLPLELIPEESPADVTAGGELTVRLLAGGVPLPDVPVVAMPAEMPGRRDWAQTDGTGRARLRLDRGGVWLVRSIRIAIAPDAAVADWESLWASLTFTIASDSPRSDLGNLLAHLRKGDVR
jgi:hypothetical protein